MERKNCHCCGAAPKYLAGLLDVPTIRGAMSVAMIAALVPVGDDNSPPGDKVWQIR